MASLIEDIAAGERVGEPRSLLEQTLGIEPRAPLTAITDTAGQEQATPGTLGEPIPESDLEVDDGLSPPELEIIEEKGPPGVPIPGNPIPESDLIPEGEDADNEAGVPDFERVLKGNVAETLMFDNLQREQEREMKEEQKAAEIRYVMPPDTEYDEKDTFSDGVGGFLVAADLGRNAELHNKQLKFMEAYPEGSLIQVQTSDGAVLLARPDPSTPYRQLPFSAGLASSVFSEVTVGGIAGSTFGILAGGAGAAGGSLAQSGIEGARGFPNDTYLQDAGLEGALGVGTGAIAQTFGRIFLGKVRPDIQYKALDDALTAVDEMGLEPITTGQTGEHFVKKFFHQVGQTSPRIEHTITKQQKGLLDALKVRGEVPDGAPDEALNALLAAQHRQLASMMNLEAMGRANAGEALQKGVELYKISSKTQRDRLYDKAIELSDDVVFDLTPAKTAASKIQLGVKGRGMQGRDELGHFTAAELIQLKKTPTGELAAVLDDLDALNPKISKVMEEGPDGEEVWTAFEQVKAIRTRLFDLKDADDGSVRRAANDLYNQLTGVMDNPISGNPHFTRAYQRASHFNHIRENTLELSFVTRAIRTDTPSQLATRYYTPHKSEELAAIKSIIPEEQWGEFTQGFAAELAETPSPTTALNRLSTFMSLDPKGLGLLMDAPTQRDMLMFLTKKAQFEASPARKILGKQMTQAERFVAFAKEGTAGEIKDSVELAGGYSSEYARMARAGVFKDILDRASFHNEAGVEVVNPAEIARAIADWRKTGKLEAFMTDVDLAKLANVSAYSSIISSGGDIGGAMMGGQVRQSVADIPADIMQGNFGKIKGVMRKVFGNELVATILTQPARLGRAVGDRLGPGDIPYRSLMAGLAHTQSQLEKSKEGRELQQTR
jgi:hypothetical protein